MSRVKNIDEQVGLESQCMWVQVMLLHVPQKPKKGEI